MRQGKSIFIPSKILNFILASGPLKKKKKKRTPPFPFVFQLALWNKHALFNTVKGTRLDRNNVQKLSGPAGEVGRGEVGGWEAGGGGGEEGGT